MTLESHISPGPDFVRDAQSTQPVRKIISWVTLAILLLAMIVAYVDRGIIALMIDPIKHDLGVTDFQVSLIQGASFAVFYALFGLPLGLLIDRLPRRSMIYGGMTVWSLATAFCGLSASYSQLFLARIGVGAGEATLAPAAYAIITDIFPSRRLALAIGIFQSGSALGTGAALIVGGEILRLAIRLGPIHLPLVGVLHPWQETFLVIGLAGIVFAGLIWLIPAVKKKTNSSELTNSADFWDFITGHRKYLASHFTTCCIVSMLAFALPSWLPTYLSRHYHLAPSHVGVLVGFVLAIPAVLGFVCAGVVVDHLFVRGIRNAHFRYAMFATLLMTATGITAMIVPGLVPCLVFVALTQFLFCITGPMIAHLQLVTPSQLRGRVSALYVAVFILVGVGLGSSIVAFFTDYVFRDTAAVGLSLASTFAVLGPIGLLASFLGLGPAREAVKTKFAR